MPPYACRGKLGLLVCLRWGGPEDIVRATRCSTETVSQATLGVDLEKDNTMQIRLMAVVKGFGGKQS